MKRSRSRPPTPSGGGRPAPLGRALVTIVFAGLAVLVQAVPARAQAGGAVPPTECCKPLLVPLGGRATALGNALSARSSVDAVYINPAGLAGLRDDQFVVQRATTFAGEFTGLSVFFARPGIGTLGITYRLADMLEQEVTDRNSPIVIGEFAIRDHALLASFATEVVSGLYAGLNYKLYHSGCSGTCGPELGSGTTHGVDLGVRYAPALLPALRVGAAVLNLGFPLQVINRQQADRMPARLRIGAAYDVLAHLPADSALALWVSAEVLRTLGAEAGVTIPAVGVELSYRDAAFVRAGHVRADGLEGWTALGVGFEYNRFSVAVARPFGQDLVDSGREPFQITFGVHF